MKRKLKWLAIVLAVSLLGFVTALLLWPRDRITVESWQKIRIGMTKEEVAEILGGPGKSVEEEGDEYTRLYNEQGRPPCRLEGVAMQEPEGRDRPELQAVKIWIGRRGIILIELDQDNHVLLKEFQGVRWINGNIFDRLRDWLGW